MPAIFGKSRTRSDTFLDIGILKLCHLETGSSPFRLPCSCASWTHDSIDPTHPKNCCNCICLRSTTSHKYMYIVEGRNMDRWKAEMGRVREEKRREKKKEDQRREIKKKEDWGARRGRKVAMHYVFPMILGSGRSKSRLAKAAGAEPCGQMRDAKWHCGTPLWKHVMFGPLWEV